MVRWRTLVALLFAALIALAPSMADARAGGSYRGGGGSFMSQGSRGSRTFDQPMQRSLTPQQSPASGLPGSGYGTSHPFWTGLAGGLFGGWLGSMLFPHWGMGYGTGFHSLIGSVFSWMVIIGLLWLGYRMFFGHGVRPLASLGSGSRLYGGLGGMTGMAGMAPGSGGAAAAPSGPLAIAQADYQAFETILKGVQAAWSDANLAGLRQFVTPEMLSYFSEELAENESQGVVNRVGQVELLRGDLREAWDEGRLHYATCYLRWRALDYTVRSGRRPGDADYLAGGDPRQASEAAEVWTFARSPGGHWLLSAIQQA